MFEGFFSNISDISKAAGKTAIKMAPEYIDVAGRIIGGAFNVGRIGGGSVTGDIALDSSIRNIARAGRTIGRTLKTVQAQSQQNQLR